MPKIGWQVRADIAARLSNAGSGFNPNFTAALTAYGLDPTIIAWNGIQFPMGTQNSPPLVKASNFFFGNVDPDSMEEDAAFSYPVMTLSIQSIPHAPGSQSYVKGATFAGPVIGVIRLHLSWHYEDIPVDLESWGDAVEDAMFQTITNPKTMMWSQSNVFGGPLTCARGTVKGGGYG